MREFAHEFVDEFFANFVHEFKYEIRTNSYEFFARKIGYVTNGLYGIGNISTENVETILFKHAFGSQNENKIFQVISLDILKLSKFIDISYLRRKSI